MRSLQWAVDAAEVRVHQRSTGNDGVTNQLSADLDDLCRHRWDQTRSTTSAAARTVLGSNTKYFSPPKRATKSLVREDAEVR